MTHSLQVTANSTAKAPWRSEEADALPTPLPLPLRQPSFSLSTDGEVSGLHTPCFQLMASVRLGLQAWMGRKWPQGTVGPGGAWLQLPQPPVSGWPSQGWPITPSRKPNLPMSGGGYDG